MNLAQRPVITIMNDVSDPIIRMKPLGWTYTHVH